MSSKADYLLTQVTSSFFWCIQLSFFIIDCAHSYFLVLLCTFYDGINGILDLDPFIFQEEAKKVLSKSYHYSAVNNTPIGGRATQNSWYDEECHQMMSLEQEVTWGICTQKHASTAFQRLVRRRHHICLNLT